MTPPRDALRALAGQATLTLTEFREVNVRRCAAAFGPLEEHSLEFFGLAMAGEAGEACNVVKKHVRGDADPDWRTKLGAELADVITYVDLLAARAGIDLTSALIEKFNAVSARRGCAITLAATPAAPEPAGEPERCENPQPWTFCPHTPPCRRPAGWPGAPR